VVRGRIGPATVQPWRGCTLALNKAGKIGGAILRKSEAIQSRRAKVAFLSEGSAA